MLLRHLQLAARGTLLIHSRIDLCENGNAFPPRISLTEDSPTPRNSQKLISQDEAWFAVDAGNANLRGNAEDLGSVRLELVPRADYDIWLKNLSK
jgi:hypothetical protein